jgi:hypothetical protein
MYANCDAILLAPSWFRHDTTMGDVPDALEMHMRTCTSFFSAGNTPIFTSRRTKGIMMIGPRINLYIALKREHVIRNMIVRRYGLSSLGESDAYPSFVHSNMGSYLTV